MNIRVYGTPAPQGSKRHVGRGVMIESSAKVKPWREAVKYAAREAVGSPMIEGPLVVDLMFYMPRGSSIPKRRIRPHVKPDLDKLVRSTFDGLGEAGVWRDDAQVVSLFTSKHYASDVPAGVDIEIKQWGSNESTPEGSRP